MPMVLRVLMVPMVLAVRVVLGDQEGDCEVA